VPGSTAHIGDIKHHAQNMSGTQPRAKSGTTFV